MTLKVSIVTPARSVLVGEYHEILAPSVLGEVGILPMHRPLLADLKAGELVLKNETKAQRMVVTGGFLEVADDTLIILAESAEWVDDIDVGKVKAELLEAEANLRGVDANNPIYAYNQAIIGKAHARLQAVEN